jgi:hypothetical protein
MLKMAKHKLVIAQIVEDYTHIDELLGTIIVKYFFDFGAKNARQLWRTKRFERFNHFILERMYLVQKLALVKAIRPVPREAARFVEKSNDLRNAVAHSFFPENLRGERTMYDNKNVFSPEGFGRYAEDRG